MDEFQAVRDGVFKVRVNFFFGCALFYVFKNQFGVFIYGSDIPAYKNQSDLQVVQR